MKCDSLHENAFTNYSIQSEQAVLWTCNSLVLQLIWFSAAIYIECFYEPLENLQWRWQFMNTFTDGSDQSELLHRNGFRNLECDQIPVFMFIPNLHLGFMNELILS